MPIDKRAERIRSMMKEGTSLSLTSEPEQIDSSVSEIMNECQEGGLPYKFTRE